MTSEEDQAPGEMERGQGPGRTGLSERSPWAGGPWRRSTWGSYELSPSITELSSEPPLHGAFRGKVHPSPHKHLFCSKDVYFPRPDQIPPLTLEHPVGLNPVTFG